MTVFVIATCDTKGTEAAFVRDRLRQLNLPSMLIDVSCSHSATFPADVSRDEILQSESLDADRGRAVERMATSVSNWFGDQQAHSKVSGVIGLGGSAGTTIATTAMRRLPIDIPKIMISTLASSNVRPWVADKNIYMFNSIVDIAGLNRISRLILDDAVRAMAGLVTIPKELTTRNERPVIAATMFGVTTPCVQRARSALEAEGFEVLVFHATGNGGQAMESLIEAGAIDAILDMTTTELADELVGGILSAGPDRLKAASSRGIPQLVSVGALDMVNFGPLPTVPDRFLHRQFHVHNPTVTLMRTTKDENYQLGNWIGERASQSRGPIQVWFPNKGVSSIDGIGQPFDSPECREYLLRGLQRHADHFQLVVRDEHINDASFATAAAEALISMMQAKSNSV
ncbi:MAG: Tm-1-like ATP-binding domain-containing protein [Pirellula sp.]